MIFLEQICSKRVFPVENGKREHHHCILIVRITVSIKFPFTQAIFNFGTKFARKKYSRSKTKKKNITIKFYVFELSITVKFHFKQTILNFKIKFAQKEHFRLKTEKVNTTIEFCILELMWAQHFTLNKRLWNLRANLPRKSIFGRKRKKWTSPLNSTYSNFTISSKRIFQVENRKVNIIIEFCIFELVLVSNSSLNWQFF